MKLIAFDTNIVIDILNGKTEILKKYQNYSAVYLPAVVCGELLYGAINSSRKEHNLVKFKAFIDSCIVLDQNLLMAEQYAVTRKQLKAKGTPIPENDICIAATCQLYELPLASHDKHFKYVKGLRLL